MSHHGDSWHEESAKLFAEERDAALREVKTLGARVRVLEDANARLGAEQAALRRAVSRVAAMAATLRAEAVGASPGVQSIATKIAGEIEARLEVS